MEERLPIRGTQDELDQLSLTINHFLDLLGDYLERNREFVANAAHELRSPLAAVQSSVEVTLNSDRIGRGVSGPALRNRRSVRPVAGAGQSAAAVGRNRRRPVSRWKPAPCASTSWCEKSIDMFRGAAEERGIELVGRRAANAITVEGDGDRLRQVVNNLIDNSLKFTPRGGQVLRHAPPRSPRTTSWCCTVADTGMGISPADLPHVFERFYRGDKSRQREDLTHGNGLGLSICQSIVMAHGGTIRVESNPGRGTTFIVCLPWSATASRRAAGGARNRSRDLNRRWRATVRNSTAWLAPAAASLPGAAAMPR